jgi:hypothetical protein
LWIREWGDVGSVISFASLRLNSLLTHRRNHVIDLRLFQSDRIPVNLLANLDTRDVTLWVGKLPGISDSNRLAEFLGLPWRQVIVEDVDASVLNQLEAADVFTNPMVTKRGFAQLIDSDPSQIELPQRCLPIYFLRGRSQKEAESSYALQVRRMTMLEALRRSGSRQVLVLPEQDSAIPAGLLDLWSAGFRSELYVAAETDETNNLLDEQLRALAGNARATALRFPASEIVLEVLSQYSSGYPDEQTVVRLRTLDGDMRRVDVTSLENPQQPVLDRFSLIQEKDLATLVPEELHEDEFAEFFNNPTTSWRPYAAGLPWIRDASWAKNLIEVIQSIDAAGHEANAIAYVASAPGAGGTTLARALGWHAATLGYPVLVAKPLPFHPEPLPVANFMAEIQTEFTRQADSRAPSPRDPEVIEGQEGVSRPRYEAPWLLIFDTLHWEHRDGELIRFRNELQRLGRPVCILVVTDNQLTFPFLNTDLFHEIATLNHAITKESSRAMGRSLNEFLRVYGKDRPESQWDQFYEQHTLSFLDGQASFWVSLSFWVQRQLNLDESIQEWIYQVFKKEATDPVVQQAVLEIAALSSERYPMPEALLPPSAGPWPIGQVLEDHIKALSALGLVQFEEGGTKYWALIHDILGRFLLNALFYDFPSRESYGLGEAQDPDHLRFLLLRRISRKSALGEKGYRAIGEDFATAIFKIDPDHGQGASLAPRWREVLEALESMPQPLRDGSRLFRHHLAISRRRIAFLDPVFYSVSRQDKRSLLEHAIADISYALTFLPYTPGSESNLNLYNSLANAYIGLSKVAAAEGASSDEIADLRKKAGEATRNAFEQNPSNSFVVETYVNNLLQEALFTPEKATRCCVEALGVLYSAASADKSTFRGAKLGHLADEAVSILFMSGADRELNSAPATAVDVLLNAWIALTGGGAGWVPDNLADLPRPQQEQALGLLEDPAGRGNIQILTLQYYLTAEVHPVDFREQIDIIEQIQAGNQNFAPQLRLEYGILLYQNGRAAEGERVFRGLRQLWKESEHFVHVPERLRWLRSEDHKSVRSLHATVGSGSGYRPMARVQEFGNAFVPFRPEEHGLRVVNPGLRFDCHVIFGHFGPFLRPVTARPAEPSEKRDD